MENIENGIINQVPCDDIYAILLESPQITISNYALSYCLTKDIAIITTDSYHLPNGIMLPFRNNHIFTKRLKQQIEIKKTLRKQLWKTIIGYKIKNQILLLERSKKNTNRLNNILKELKSGDKTNCESQAAVYYWKNIFNFDFKRDREGEFPNSHLNYGYSIIRSAIARQIVLSGYSPALGLHHKNIYNPFCLADDLMEPYRPFVDKKVIELINSYGDNLFPTKEEKIELINVQFEKVIFLKNYKTIINSIENVIDLYNQSIETNNDLLQYPLLLE